MEHFYVIDSLITHDFVKASRPSHPNDGDAQVRMGHTTLRVRKGPTPASTSLVEMQSGTAGRAVNGDAGPDRRRGKCSLSLTAEDDWALWASQCPEAVPS